MLPDPFQPRPAFDRSSGLICCESQVLEGSSGKEPCWAVRVPARHGHRCVAHDLNRSAWALPRTTGPVTGATALMRLTAETELNASSTPGIKWPSSTACRRALCQLGRARRIHPRYRAPPLLLAGTQHTVLADSGSETSRHGSRGVALLKKTTIALIPRSFTISPDFDCPDHLVAELFGAPAELRDCPVHISGRYNQTRPLLSRQGRRCSRGLLLWATFGWFIGEIRHSSTKMGNPNLVLHVRGLTSCRGETPGDQSKWTVASSKK